MMERYAKFIARQFDLEPNNFKIVADQHKPEEIKIRAVDNILPLALGRHEIIFDRNQLDADMEAQAAGLPLAK